jgi:hypothetical protein
MRKDVNMEFLKCHSCSYLIDVSKQVVIFNKNPDKQIIKKICDKCSSISQCIIPMIGGITSIELINTKPNALAGIVKANIYGKHNKNGDFKIIKKENN